MSNYSNKHPHTAQCAVEECDEDGLKVRLLPAGGAGWFCGKHEPEDIELIKAYGKDSWALADEAEAGYDPAKFRLAKFREARRRPSGPQAR